MARREGISLAAVGTEPLRIEADALAVPVYEGDVGRAPSALVRALDERLGGALSRAIRGERFEGKSGQELRLATLGRLPAATLLLEGLGARGRGDAFDGTSPDYPRPAKRGWGGGNGNEPLRVAAGRAARAAAKAGGRSFAVVVPEGPRPSPDDLRPARRGGGGGDLARAARAAAEGALLGGYQFRRYKTARRAAAGLGAVRVALPAGAARSAEVKAELALASEIAAAVVWARDLVNLGPADCTPTHLAAAARTLAREAGLRFEVRGPREIAGLKMGMFLGVTRGSAEAPRLVTVSFVPAGAGARRAPVVLVGKAITFDSGGLSLKPTESMVTMNTDMAGSAAVLGAMRVVSALAPPFPVHAVLGACENMPGGRAYKPSDVLVAADGQTVEITNTDAEGRLVLGDVIAWASRRWKPAAMVDVATLTGACMVALGATTAGLLGPDGPVVDGVLAAARAAGEEVWRLPLVESLKEQLKSDRADMKNTGDRFGGAISAAHFLHAFAKETPWAHLDIAGPSHAAKERGYVAKGGTGFGLRTLVEFVRAWAPA